MKDVGQAHIWTSKNAEKLENTEVEFFWKILIFDDFVIFDFSSEMVNFWHVLATIWNGWRQKLWGV